MDRLSVYKGKVVRELKEGLWVLAYDYDEGGSVCWKEYYSKGVLEGEGVLYEY